MGRVRIWNGGAAKVRAPKHEFTVVLVPVFDTETSSKSVSKQKKAQPVRLPNPLTPTGYQVTVPSLPGLITYGRTEAEAWSMAQDAIRCHIEGLQKDGVPIPDESDTQFRKLRISA